MESQTGDQPDKLAHIRQQYEQAIPAGRIGYPKEFAETVLWLCAGKGSYLTGHSLIIDGGMSSRFR